MDLRLLVLKAHRRLRQIGLAAAIRESIECVRFRRVQDDFDKRYGTDTSGSDPLWRHRISSANARFGVKYQPTGEDELTVAVKSLGIDPAEFTFVDLGCGKGRTLLVAARVGFRQAIGVEFTADFVAVARNNIRILGITNAVVVHEDAADFRFPDGDVVLYIYNPFSQEVMEKVIGRLNEARLKRLYVVYKVASCAALFDSSGFLRRLESPAGTPSIGLWMKEG